MEGRRSEQRRREGEEDSRREKGRVEGRTEHRPLNSLPLATAEGIKAVDDAISALRLQQPVPALQEWPGMSAAAAAAVQDSGSKGIMKKVRGRIIPVI